MWIFLSLALALSPPPPPLALQSQEASTLASGGILFRFDPAGETIAAIDIAAPPTAVMAAVMDLPPRAREVAALQSVAVYDSSPGRVSARIEMGNAVYKAAFHIRYTYDVAAGWCVYGLDTSRENDLQAAGGSYQVYAVEGGSRLVYRASQVSSIIPDWLMERLAREGAEQLLRGIEARAEE